MVTRRGSRSFSLSDLDHSEGEQSLLTLNAPRRQSLGLGVTHCPLPYVQEEEEKEEGDDDEEEEEGGNESSCEHNDSDVREEGCWAWLVVFSSFICLCVLDGVSYTFGMFLQPLTADLGIGLGAASMIGSLQVAVTCASGVISARVVVAVGPRPVAMVGALLASAGLLTASFASDLASILSTYSLLAGLGFGLMYVPAVVAVAEHFTKRRALATGLCVCGTGVGTSLLAPLEEMLLSEAGWRTAMQALALLCSICVICGATMSRPEGLHPPLQSDTHATPQHQHQEARPRGALVLLLGYDLANSPLLSSFISIALADSLATLALFLPFLFLPDLAKSSGIEADKAAWLVSAAGLSSSLGRILSGLLCDKPWCNPIVLTTVAVGLASIPPLLLPLASSFLTLFILASAYGILTGAWIAATSPLLVSILGLNLLPAAFGIMTAGQGVFAMLGPPLAGALVEAAGHRGPALQLSGAVLLAASCGFLLAYRMVRRSRDYQMM